MNDDRTCTPRAVGQAMAISAGAAVAVLGFILLAGALLQGWPT